MVLRRSVCRQDASRRKMLLRQPRKARRRYAMVSAQQVSQPNSEVFAMRVMCAIFSARICSRHAVLYGEVLPSMPSVAARHAPLTLLLQRQPHALCPQSRKESAAGRAKPGAGVRACATAHPPKCAPAKARPPGRRRKYGNTTHAATRRCRCC